MTKSLKQWVLQVGTNQPGHLPGLITLLSTVWVTKNQQCFHTTSKDDDDELEFNDASTLLGH